MKLHNLLFVFALLTNNFLIEVQAREIPLPTADSINAIELIDSNIFDDTLVLVPVSFCDTDPFGTIGVIDPLAVSYQWFIENPPLSGIWDPIPGETNATYDAPFSAITEYYRVEITYAAGPPIPFPYEVTFHPVPIVETPADDLSSCNLNLFNLTANGDLIIGTQPNFTEFEVRYFGDPVDANNGSGPSEISTPNAYAIPIAEIPTKIIYARIHNIFNNDCYELDDFIIDYRTVDIGFITDYPVCDNIPLGLEPVDLTVKDTEALNGQVFADYTVSYHGSQVDADANANPHGTPYNATAPTEIIYVRVENNANTDCYLTTTFNVVITTIPIPAPPTPLEECDIEEFLGAPINNGITIFDLTTKDLEIIGINTDVSVRYFEDPLDASNGANEINPATAFENTTSPGSQTIFARLESDFNSDCFNIVPLQLIVNPIPDGLGLYPVDPYFYEQCDESEVPGVGIEIFDLTQHEIDILTGGQTWDFTYHTTLEGAEDPVLDPDPIIFPAIYENTDLNEIIYIRVSIDITDPDSCFVILEIPLTLHLLPVTTIRNFEDPLIECEVDTDGVATFNFTENILAILTAQDVPADNLVTLYTRQLFADLAINEIDPVDSFESFGRTIYVRIDNIITGCYTTELSFEIEVREGATANRPLEAYTVCDEDPFDGFEEFDLTDPILIAEILGDQVGGPYMTEFYLSPSDAIDELDPISPFYTNVINPQLVYVRVTNTETECYDITSVILKVEHPPIVILEDSYRLCVDENGVPIAEEDGEQSPPVIDTGFDPFNYSFVWELNGAILGAETGPSLTVVQEGDYTVTVTEISTTCSASASTTVTLSSPPLIYDAVVTSDAFADIHTIIATVAEGIGEYEFQLDDGPFQDDGNFIDIKPGTHIVTIRDKFGCGSVTIELGVIDYPRFITPNEDGFHDTWNILGISIGDPSAKIYIFDRFGKLLTQISPTEGGWDGNYNGNPLPSSDYWFRIVYTERDQAGTDVQKEFRGHFSLKR